MEKKTISLRAAIATGLSGQSHHREVMFAKAQAQNLEIVIKDRTTRLVEANKYEAPHQGKREQERRAKRLAKKV